MSAQPVVQVEDLDVYYGTSQILFGVGLSVRRCSAATALASRPP
jgi:branched-chain amino acid transport system ATP-binding protein